MKVSLNWLRDYVGLSASAEEITQAITFLGFEVEGVATSGAPALEQVVVGEVLTRERHPNADRLSVCTVDVGPAGGVKTIVCGAQNYGPGDRVPVALPGAVLPGNFTIKQSKIRGQSSEGMMCSGRELGVSEDQSGLLILSGRPALGTPINAVLPPPDTIFDLEVTPNRPDCLCHLGLARELAAWSGQALAYPEVKFSPNPPPPEPAHPLLKAVRVGSPQDCPLYLAYPVAGVKIGPSPDWIQARLRAVGLRPVNNVVDATNYVMLEYGQPLHAFDARKLRGAEIIVRPASDGEVLATLDGRERTLASGMLVIADAQGPVAVAGVMGGAGSGVGPETTDLVLECAIFRRQSVRATARALGLTSDAAYRYERGVDPHTAPEAARRALDLILATAGGRVVGPVFQVGGEAPWKREIVISPGYVRERLGFELPDAAMRAALEALELRIAREAPAPGGGPAWTVAIPSWRDDLDRPIDLVEEILRLHGTEKIPPAAVVVPALPGEDDPTVRFARRATAYLVGHDFHECVNYTLRSGRELSTWVSQAAAAELALSNPLAEDQSHLRPSLIMGLLDNLRLNQSRGVPVSRLAETGRVFIESNGQNYECAAAAFIIADDPERRWKHREPADFYTAKRHVQALAAAAGIDLEAQPPEAAARAQSAWQEGHCAAAGGLREGWAARFGLLNLALVRGLGITGKVHAGIFAILPEKLSVSRPRPRHQDFSLQPAALRDLALVADEAVPAGDIRREVEAAARAAAGSAFGLEEVSIFDVYRGQGIPAGKKGVAFSLVFRSGERTLTDEEVNAALKRVQESLRRSGAYTIRE